MIYVQHEMALLSVLISDNSLMDAVFFLNGHDFSCDFCGTVFESIKKINSEGRKADLVTISDVMSGVAAGTLYTDLYDVINSPASAENLDLYAQCIFEQAKKRKALKIIHSILEGANHSESDIDTLITKAIESLSNLENLGVQEIKSFGFLSEKFLELLDKRMHSKNGLIGISTGFKDLDNLTHGFSGGQLIVLGARPGHGKTTLAANIAMTNVKNGGSTAFFSLEMRDISMYERFIASESGVDSKKIKNGQLNNQEVQEIVYTIKAISDKKLFLLDAANTQEIAKQAHQIKKKNGLDFIVVDYLGLLLNGKHEHAHLVLGEITRNLKKLAIQLDIPILLLSQLNREIEKRPDPTPKLSDLRQSGSIEQDADIVMFLSQYDRDKPSSPLHGYGVLDIAKHRDGEVETIILGFEGHKNRFVETTMTLSRFEELKSRQKNVKGNSPGFAAPPF